MTQPVWVTYYMLHDLPDEDISLMSSQNFPSHRLWPLPFGISSDASKENMALSSLQQPHRWLHVITGFCFLFAHFCSEATFSGLLTILAAICRTPVQVFHIFLQWGPWAAPKIVGTPAPGHRGENNSLQRAGHASLHGAQDMPGLICQRSSLVGDLFMCLCLVVQLVKSGRTLAFL